MKHTGKGGMTIAAAPLLALQARRRETQTFSQIHVAHPLVLRNQHLNATLAPGYRLHSETV